MRILYNYRVSILITFGIVVSIFLPVLWWWINWTTIFQAILYNSHYLVLGGASILCGLQLRRDKKTSQLFLGTNKK